MFSRIVGLLSYGSRHFVLRSAGYGLLVGSSNITVGVTINTSGINSVILSVDNTVAQVQPGGGRAGDVEIGG